MNKSLVLLNHPQLQYLNDSTDDQFGISRKLKLLSQLNLDSMDTYGNHRSFNTDSNESIFVANQLQNIENQVYTHKTAPLKYSMVFPIEFIPDGANEIGYDEQQMKGEAKIIAAGSQDVPAVNIVKSRNLQNVYSLMTMYNFDYDTLQSAIYANMPLSADLAVAARKAIEQTHNNLAFNGNAEYAIPGLTSSTKLSSYTNAGVTTNWMASGTTSAQLIADINTIVNLITTTSLENYDAQDTPIMLLVPIEVRTKLMTMPYSSSQQSLGSVWSYVQQIYPNLKLVGTDKLKNALTSNKNCAFAFPYSPEVLSYGMVPIKQLPTTSEGINYKTFVRSRTAGLKYKQPKLIVYSNISA